VKGEKRNTDSEEETNQNRVYHLTEGANGGGNGGVGTVGGENLDIIGKNTSIQNDV